MNDEIAPRDQVPVAAVAAGPVDAGQVFRWTVAAGFGLLAVFLVAMAIYSMQTLLVQMLIAVFIAVSLDPLVRWMIGRGIKRSQAVAVIFVVTIAIVAALVWIFAPALVRQANALTTDFPGYIEQLRERSPQLRGLEDQFNLAPRIDQWVQTAPAKMSEQALSFSRQFLGALVSVLLVMVMTIYLMSDLARLRRGLVRLFPKRHRPQISEAVNLIVDKVGSYMIGNLLISAIAGVTAFIALWALGVPFGASAGAAGRDHRSHPAHRRHRRRGDLHDRVRGHDRHLADDNPRGVVFPSLPTGGELRDRAAGAAQHRGHLLGRRAFRGPGRREHPGRDRGAARDSGRRGPEGHHLRLDPRSRRGDSPARAT